MRYYKHFTSQDKQLEDHLIDEFGIEGYGIFYRMKSIVYSQCEAPEWSKSLRFSERIWARKLRISKRKLRNFVQLLGIFTDFAKVVSEVKNNMYIYEISFPTITRDSDRYTLPKVDTNCTESTPRTEQNRTKDNILGTKQPEDPKKDLPKKVLKKSKNNIPTEFKDWFENHIWVPYPRRPRGDKDKCMSNVWKIVNGNIATKEELAEAVDHMARRADGNPEKFNPHPRTFFNPKGEQWVDWLSKTYEVKDEKNTNGQYNYEKSGQV